MNLSFGRHGVVAKSEKLRESGFVAKMSLMIKIAVKPHAATFPQL